MKHTPSARYGRGYLKTFRPATRSLKGFSAINLILVMSITLICVVVGAPSVSGFTTRGKMVEALGAAESAKKAVAISCAVNSNLDELSNSLVGYEFLESRYVRDVKVEGSCQEPVITIFTANTGLSFDPLIAIYGDSGTGGSVAWNCVSNGHDEWLPENCRR